MAKKSATPKKKVVKSVKAHQAHVTEPVLHKQTSGAVNIVAESSPLPRTELEMSAKIDESEQESASSQVQEVSSRFTKPRMIIIGGVGIIIIGLMASVLYFYNQYQKTQIMMQHDSPSAAPEAQQLVARVGNLMMLPHETPTVATVSDISKLANQPFFISARNGDKVLIYKIAQEAILYRPSINKIITMAPFTLNTASSANSPTAMPSFTVEIFNGTTTTGLSRTVKHDLSTSVPQATVVDTNNARVATYSSTLVVDIHNHASDAAVLAKAVKGTVASLPDGETKPNTDFLVIVGADYLKK